MLQRCHSSVEKQLPKTAYLRMKYPLISIDYEVARLARYLQVMETP